MTEKQPSERQRRKWREDRARLRLTHFVVLFPLPPKPQLTVEERRERKAATARDARAVKALASLDFISPMFHEDGRIIRSKPAPKREKAPERRAKGPWD